MICTNINVLKTSKIYESAGKCDHQQQYKAIIEKAMVSTPEGFTENIPMYYVTSVTLKQPNTRKSLPQFSEALDVKPNTDARRLCDSK